MTGPSLRLARAWSKLGLRYLPFADAASPALPMGRLLRLSLFQVTVGMATALLVGTLNRVMIVELSLPAVLVSTMVALPILFAPLRAFIGFRSDNHRSVLGWRRVPYLWFGTLLQFGGFAFMPFALLVLSSEGDGHEVVGSIAAALAFLMVGAGLQTTQTAGLALATDLARDEDRPRVVALLYVMLLVGVVTASLIFGWALQDFSEVRLIQVVQGAAAATMALNLVALWKQEARDPGRTRMDVPVPRFRDEWRAFTSRPGARRLLVVVGLGTAAFSMQDIVLEPYGGQVMHLSVSATTLLTALLAVGALAAFSFAGWRLGHGADPMRLAGLGAVIGLPAFAAVALAAPLESGPLFLAGTLLIGLGGGLFSVGTLTAAMWRDDAEDKGLALGAWGAVQATALGLGTAAGGAIRDLVGAAAERGLLGPVLSDRSTGYSVVYTLEIVLIFATLALVGRLVNYEQPAGRRPSRAFGLAELPG